MVGYLFKKKNKKNPQTHTVMCPLSSNIPVVKCTLVQDPTSRLYEKLPACLQQKQTYHSMHLLQMACEMPQNQQSVLLKKLILYSPILTHRPRSPC